MTKFSRFIKLVMMAVAVITLLGFPTQTSAYPGEGWVNEQKKELEEAAEEKAREKMEEEADKHAFKGSFALGEHAINYFGSGRFLNPLGYTSRGKRFLAGLLLGFVLVFLHSPGLREKTRKGVGKAMFWFSVIAFVVFVLGVAFELISSFPPWASSFIFLAFYWSGFAGLPLLGLAIRWKLLRDLKISMQAGRSAMLHYLGHLRSPFEEGEDGENLEEEDDEDSEEEDLEEDESVQTEETPSVASEPSPGSEQAVPVAEPTQPQPAPTVVAQAPPSQVAKGPSCPSCHTPFQEASDAFCGNCGHSMQPMPVAAPRRSIRSQKRDIFR